MRETERQTWPYDQRELSASAKEPVEMEEPRPGVGTHRGVASKRPFFYGEISLPIERQTLAGIRVTRDGLARIRGHLARFDPDPGNDVMLARLEAILAGDLPFSEYDARFYSHELRELERFEAAGWAHGRPASDDELWRLWNNEHTATLEEFGFNEMEQPLYHPEADDDDT